MRDTSFRGWLAAFLLLAVFSSSPFGSVEQPSSTPGAQTVSEVFDAQSLPPSPVVRESPTGTPLIGPATQAVHFLAWADVAAARPVPPPQRRRTATPHLSYDALAPPRI